LFTLSGKPFTSWNWLPVMPQAIAGEEKGGVYYYYLRSSRDVVRQYYVDVMPSWGWQLFSAETKANGDVLIFIKGHTTITVGIVVSGDLVSVMLVNS
jgi:hypothetical protein